MERKAFIRNLIGSAAAIAVVPQIESLLPVPVAPLLPGIGGTVFRMNFIRGTLVVGDLIRMSGHPNEIYIQRKESEELVGVDVETGQDVVLVEETERYNYGILDLHGPNNNAMTWSSNGHTVAKLCHALPEEMSYPIPVHQHLYRPLESMDELQELVSNLRR